MAWLEKAALILSALLTVGTLLGVTLPNLSERLKKHFSDEGKWRLRQEIKSIRELLTELKEKEKERSEAEKIQQEVDLCVLRDLITNIYYKRVKEKTIFRYELEDAHALYALYCKRGGNSYVHTLIRQMKEWETKE